MPEPLDDVGRFRLLIRRIARRLHGGHDAEDLLHDAYLRLAEFRARRDGAAEPIANPDAYMVRTAVNLGIDARRRDRKIDGSAAVEMRCRDMEDHAPLQDEVLAARRRLARVQEGLKRLTPRTREVFLMHRLDGLKYREVAERLGISQSAVEKHIAKAALFLTEWTEGF